MRVRKKVLGLKTAKMGIGENLVLILLINVILYIVGPVTHGPGEAIGAPDHPHRGFETVTYLIDGEMCHKDSVGNSGNHLLKRYYRR